MLGIFARVVLLAVIGLGTPARASGCSLRAAAAPLAMPSSPALPATVAVPVPVVAAVGVAVPMISLVAAVAVAASVLVTVAVATVLRMVGVPRVRVLAAPRLATGWTAAGSWGPRLTALPLGGRRGRRGS